MQGVQEVRTQATTYINSSGCSILYLCCVVLGGIMDTVPFVSYCVAYTAMIPIGLLFPVGMFVGAIISSFIFYVNSKGEMTNAYN